VIGAPFAADAVKLTLALPEPAVAALTPVGAPGTPAGVTAFDGFDAGPVPFAFVAVTVNVYAVPFVSPLTRIGLPLPDTLKPPGEAVTV